MNYEDTYRMEDLPPEAAMMPATEEIPDAPPPAARTLIREEASSRVPAQTSAASRRLERLRNRMHAIPHESMQWMDAGNMPLDRGSAQGKKTSGAPRTQVQPQAIRENHTITNGAALNTLLRSAVRQHAPAPELSRMAGVPGTRTVSQEQMRGALRNVVRSAQQPTQTMWRD